MNRPVFLSYLITLLIAISEADECPSLSAQFSTCAQLELTSGGCTFDNNTGYLDYCQPCAGYYDPWIKCHCRDMTTPYGISECRDQCEVYFACEAKVAFDDDQCLTELSKFQQCTQQHAVPIENPPKSISKLKPNITKEFLMKDPPFPYCHVCSLAELEDGTVVAVFQAGSNEDAVDSSIWITSRNPTTEEWSPVRVALKGDNVCFMNPSIYLNSENVLFLTFHLGGNSDGTCNTDRWIGAYSSSIDGGLTWSSPILLPQGFLGGIKNKCIKISNGAVLCPSSTETIIADSIEFWQAHIETTDDTFSSWSKSNEIRFNFNSETQTLCPYYGTIQPTLFELEKGHILSLQRSGCKGIAAARSFDFGKTFSEHAFPTGLPNPNGGIDGVKMQGEKDIDLLLVFNNSTTKRTPLTLAHSLDDGFSWMHIEDLQIDANITFQYPAVIQSKKNPRVAHVCYSWVSKTRNMGYIKVEF